MSTRLPDIPALDDAPLREQVDARLRARLADPATIGRPVELAHQFARIQGRADPVIDQPHLVVFAADHGIATRGVSTQPDDATRRMIDRLVDGTAAVPALCESAGVRLRVVDCGVQGHDTMTDRGDGGGVLRSARIAGAAEGTDDCSRQIAMAPATRNVAIENGMRLMRETPGNAVLIGSLGIGSSSSAALMMALLTDHPIEQCAGRGVGLDNVGMARKMTVLRMAMQKHARAVEPLAALASVGGLETATQVGAILQAAHERRIIVIDGFGATAAVAVAARVAPHVLQRCVFAHRQADTGHGRWLERLGVEPLLDLGIRTGDGVGASMAWNVVRAAAALLGGGHAFR